MNILNRHKQTITLSHNGKTVTYTRAGIGFEYVDELLCHPHQPILCSHLKQLYQIDPNALSGDDFNEVQSQTVPFCGKFPFLPNEQPIAKADPQTITELKERLKHLIEEEAELSQYHDYARLDEVREEKDALLAYLKEVISPQSRPRYLSNQQRNDYSAVKQAVKRAVAKLEPDFPDLSKELTDHISFGLSIVYDRVA